MVPVIETLVPTAPIVGLNPVTVGASEAPTTNEVLVVAVPEGVVTLIGPVVAPGGTLVTICVAVAEVTIAATPLNETAFSLGVVLNAVPKIWTSAPIEPLFGVNSMIETCEELSFDIDSKLPTASYE